ncbi:MAG: hypothetical protein SVR81_04250 [Chloroflexota bacterium]|nr:hypothetical protein [Chloroflexota bacterium]
MIKIKVFSSNIFVILLILAVAVPFNTANALGVSHAIPLESYSETSVEIVNDYYSIIHTNTRGGTPLQADVINGPPAPPDREAWEASKSPIVTLDRAASTLMNFPSYDWVFGCSAVSGAMIAGYYDNNGYPDMYTGPTNGGVMPQTDTAWGAWNDGSRPYPNNPLVASHMGVDGRAGRGSIDDYWVSYLSSAYDPYITNGWPEHTPGTAIGDYMKTSQSAWPYQNVDGSTRFWNYDDHQKLTCSDMEILTYTDAGGTYSISQNDGTYGRMQFYNARGYNVTDCYNQYIEELQPGGFTLSDFQAEIDAGHPVMINLAGHTVVGYGYNNNTIYIRDTWDSDPDSLHSMTWGGSYQTMEMLSVSIVHLEAIAPPGELGKTGPADGAVVQSLSPTLTWEQSFDVSEYEYCIDTNDDGLCSNWISTGLESAVQLSGLAFNETYYWQVRAINELGVTNADGGGPGDWQFTTLALETLSEQNFIPLILN